jgi:predicted transposase
MLVKSVKCKLRINDISATALADTMTRFNAACNANSQKAWELQSFRAFDLHKMIYHPVRAEFGLPAQLAVRAIAKVTDFIQATTRIFGDSDLTQFSSR